MAGCKGHAPTPIPQKLHSIFDYESTHTCATEMARFSKILAKENNSQKVRLPLCHTLFSEAYGAQVRLGDWFEGPRVIAPSVEAEVLIGSPEEMKVKSWTRVETVLEAIGALIEEGYEVVLLLDGPITLLSNILGFEKMVRLHRKAPDSVQKMLGLLSEELLSFAGRAIDLGVKNIDFGDPLSAVSILGPVVRRNLADGIHKEILGKLSELVWNSDGILRVCPLTFNCNPEDAINMHMVCISEL